ncbi:MAG: hypothetical protein LBP22_04660 [Deltaproteobacteria bacterium]|nr:hypothetical protein [Deltaproteobacteria bacterium]
MAVAAPGCKKSLAGMYSGDETFLDGEGGQNFPQPGLAADYLRQIRACGHKKLSGPQPPPAVRDGWLACDNPCVMSDRAITAS